MIATDEEALICDLAETYNILNFKELPVHLLATLSCGLRADSRIKMKLSGMELSLETHVLIGIMDNLNIQLWQNTEDGLKNRNRPQSLLSKLLDKDGKSNEEIIVFSNSEDFERVKKEIIGGNN